MTSRDIILFLRFDPDWKLRHRHDPDYWELVSPNGRTRFVPTRSARAAAREMDIDETGTGGVTTFRLRSDMKKGQE